MIDYDNVLSFIKLSKGPHPRINIIIIMYEKANAKYSMFYKSMIKDISDYEKIEAEFRWIYFLMAIAISGQSDSCNSRINEETTRGDICTCWIITIRARTVQPGEESHRQSFGLALIHFSSIDKEGIGSVTFIRTCDPSGGLPPTTIPR